MPKSENYCRVTVHNNNETAVKGNMALDDTHQQIWTPWSLIDANAWGVWFQPSDWQFIQNSMESLNLDSFSQDIYNVVVKMVTEQGVGDQTIKVYNNDLTACMMCALDSNNILPYTPAAQTGETLGFYPWKPTTPAPYRYYFFMSRDLSATYDNDSVTVADNKGNPSGLNSQFFTIENTLPIMLLRTGDEFSTGTYKFNTEPIKLTHTWQTNRHLGMPPKLTELPSTDTEAGTLAARGDRFGQTQTQAVNYVTEALRLRPAQVGFCQPHDNFEANQGGPFKVPNVPLDITAGGDHDANGSIRFTLGRQHGHNWASANNVERFTWDAMDDGAGRHTQDCFVQTVPLNVPPNLNSILTRRDPIGGKTDMHYTNTFNSYGPLTAFPHPDPIYPNGQIWDKEVDLEHKPRLHVTAPFVCKDNPPGQLFVRLGPNLTDQFDPNSSTVSRIVTYSTFYWKGVLKFKAKLRPNSTWNPVYQMTAENHSQNGYMSVTKWLPTATGNMQSVPLMARPVARNTY